MSENNELKSSNNGTVKQPVNVFKKSLSVKAFQGEEGDFFEKIGSIWCR